MMSISFNSHRIIFSRATCSSLLHTNGAMQMSTAYTGQLHAIPKEQVSAKPFSEMPGPRGITNIPYIGFFFHLKPFTKHSMSSIDVLFKELIDRYGPTFLVQTEAPTVIVTDPDDFTTVMRYEGKYPIRPLIELLDVYYRRAKVPRGMIVMQGEEWWRLRAPVQKLLLKPQEISRYLPVMNKVTDDFVDMLSSGYLNDHNAEETILSFMAESVGTALFNKRLGFLDANKSESVKKMKQATLDLFDVLAKTLFGGSALFKFYRTKDYVKFESAHKFVGEQIEDYVKEEKIELRLKQQLGIPTDNEHSILRSLLKAVDNEEDVRVVMETIYAAAIDSSSATFQVFLHTLAKNPDKQEKLREEVIRVLDDPSLGYHENNIVTTAHLNRMPYLKAVLKEVYRCHRITPFGSMRILPVDTVLGGYHVPAGVQVYILNAKASDDEAYFKDPHIFSPERWLREGKSQSSEKENIKSWVVQPFGSGHRSCPGRRLFEQEITLSLTKILYKLRVGLAPESRDVSPEYRLFLRFTKPLKFTFTPVEKPPANVSLIDKNVIAL